MSNTVPRTFLNTQQRGYVLALIGAVVLILALVLPSFAQPQGYHDFADKRGWLGVPNFGDVASNLAFLWVGLAGLFVLRLPSVRAMAAATRQAYGLMFFGLVFTAFGSGYYHWAPSDARLVWDRLPMTVVFMPLLAATLAERLRWRSTWPLWGLTLLGLGSVLYWKWSGNLLPYLMAQGGSILLILLAVMWLRSPWTERRLLYAALASYAVAFVSEKLDRPIFELSANMASGHTIKHLAAAFAFYFMQRMLRQQQPQRDTNP
ncbi:alkaline phytoceramidase [Rhodanobacter sp. L36]|uniref:alkaline phytoceramidase n=1 Tax=Rhodanobacter sp. L36 TaxID=1747221 RepID=UPI00131D9A70|nr:alkaline phytoceramidase [Rhodanobacter sp. L36]